MLAVSSDERGKIAHWTAIMVAMAHFGLVLGIIAWASRTGSGRSADDPSAQQAAAEVGFVRSAARTAETALFVTLPSIASRITARHYS